jgi:hypothetical protein
MTTHSMTSSAAFASALELVLSGTIIGGIAAWFGFDTAIMSPNILNDIEFTALLADVGQTLQSWAMPWLDLLHSH